MRVSHLSFSASFLLPIPIIYAPPSIPSSLNRTNLGIIKAVVVVGHNSAVITVTTTSASVVVSPRVHHTSAAAIVWNVVAVAISRLWRRRRHVDAVSGHNVVLTAEALGYLTVDKSDKGECAKRLWDEHINNLRMRGGGSRVRQRKWGQRMVVGGRVQV